jgi:hypothetical protein
MLLEITPTKASMVDVVGDKLHLRRGLVVALFISTLVKFICSLSILTPTAEKLEPPQLFLFN